MKEVRILCTILIIIVGGAWVISNTGLVTIFESFLVRKNTEGVVTTDAKPIPQMAIRDIERLAFDLINLEREKNGLPITKWSEELYVLSKAHTEMMADRGELFHTSVKAIYAENVWGASWGQTSRHIMAEKMVQKWMSSPAHRKWILHPSLRTSVVSVVDDERGNFASWTFWRKEMKTSLLWK